MPIAFPDPEQPTPPKWLVVDKGVAYYTDLRLPTGEYSIIAMGTVAYRHVADNLRKEDAELICRLVNGEAVADDG